MMVDFRVMFGNRIYLYSGGTLMTLFTVLIILGLTITGSDATCKGIPDNPCISYGKICNTLPKNIYIYNKNETKLDFSPDIKEYWLFFKDGRYKKEFLIPKGVNASTVGWRFENFTNDTKPRKDRLYVHRFAAYSCQDYMIVGLKNNPTDEIKWGFGVGNEYLDPVWLPVEISFKEDKECVEYEYPYLDVKITPTCKTVYNIFNLSSNTTCTETREVTHLTETKERCTTIGWYYGTDYYSRSDWYCCEKELLCFHRKGSNTNIRPDCTIQSGEDYVNLETNDIKLDSQVYVSSYEKTK